VEGARTEARGSGGALRRLTSVCDCSREPGGVAALPVGLRKEAPCHALDGGVSEGREENQGYDLAQSSKVGAVMVLG